MRKKSVAGILALFFGILGVHRFYLRQRFWGIVHLAIFGICMIASVEEKAPFILIPAAMGFIDAILFFAIPKEDFDQKYNKEKLQRVPVYNGRHKTPVQEIDLKMETSSSKKSGVRYYREGNIADAIRSFKKALALNYEDPTTHFNIACCYSITENATQSLFHIDQAIDFGFNDFDKLHSHEALTSLRNHNRFQDFVKNNYQIDVLPPITQKNEEQIDDLLNSGDLLDQIMRLGDLKEKGIITEEEFLTQKQKILEN